MRVVWLYLLRDPFKPKCGYIGRDVKPPRRYMQHLGDTTSYGKKQNWIRALRRRGQFPTYELIAKAPYRLRNRLEITFIARAKAAGWRLKNATPGGEGGGHKHTKAFKVAMSVRFSGNGNPSKRPEVAAKMSASMRRGFENGRKPWNKGLRLPTGKPAWNTGKHTPKNVREKIGDGNRKAWTLERRLAWAKRNSGKGNPFHSKTHAYSTRARIARFARQRPRKGGRFV